MAVSLLVALASTVSSAEAGRRKSGLIGFTAGYRFETSTLNDGPTLGFFCDGKVSGIVCATGAAELHFFYPLESEDGGHPVGGGAWIGLKLTEEPTVPGIKISPGVAFGVFQRPGVYNKQHLSVRFSLNLASVEEKGAGLLLEASIVHLLSSVDSNYTLGNDAMFSVRLGVITRII